MKNDQIYLMEPNSGEVDTKENYLADMGGWEVNEDDEDALSAEEQFDSLIEVAKNVEGKWVEYSYFEMTKEQIEKELTDDDLDIRSICAMRTDFTPTYEQFQRGLLDDEWQVRQAFASRIDFKPTAENINQGLLDENENVRVAFARRKDYTPNSGQIERGLEDEIENVRLAWAERDDIVLNEAQILRGLDDNFPDVRAAFALRKEDYTPNYWEIQNGLSDTAMHVRLAWAERVVRDEIVLNEAQILRGLDDNFPDVWKVFEINEFDMRHRLERQKLGLEIKATIPTLEMKSKVMAL
jgi:hypothetical protein